MTTITHRQIESTSGLSMHIAEAGSGPLVLLLHGFPESWYSWRHQLVALAEAGYHAVAPDQRGYGGTGGPDEVDQYSLLHLSGDVLGLLPALGADRAVVVGHDWGAPVAWTSALLRPDLVRGVVGLSVPPFPRGPMPLLQLFRQLLGDDYYMVHFQQPGVADAELARDPYTTFRTVLAGRPRLSPDGIPLVPEGNGFLDMFTLPTDLPDWLTEDDLAHFATEFTANGFTRPLNWYRNLDRNWYLTAPWHNAQILPPALLILGEHDLVVANDGARAGLAALNELAPNLAEPLWLPDCGHWTQQEKPKEVNQALLGFLDGLAD
ncbi:pimeloyl-ACP methyl ester carboxylesterase [Kitasatospora gansuensis]|uniref:Pimeloyl-ACP methyl ester carboxylesterase n=1 Tax=Kitasatospora gansuensis TaxID=258050 RepID=A0A7W7SHL5_9ACTN|nr:alpha/beta hydrolase [Kitasatospora gansuensis]MBB4950629.1 pimeloyl-ACP methyl ester carboxylesterase [Kitasatospora gansuensis]